MDPNTSDMSLAEMDYKGAFSKGKLFPLPAERHYARLHYARLLAFSHL